MVAQITLGNMFTSNGKTVLTGGSSGLDVESMVDSLATAKRQPAVKLEEKIEKNAKRSEAYTELKGLLDNFHDAANFLRNPPGVRNDADNIFNYRSTSVTSSSTTSGDTYLSVTAEAGASIASYNITNVVLATKSIKTTATFALANSNSAAAVDPAGPFNAGTLVLGASATPITLTAGDTLDEVVAKINAASDDSKIEATAIKVSNGNYRISFQSTETGAAMDYNIAALNPGIFNVAFAINQVPIDASLTLDGTPITRASNSIDDLIQGVTFDLKQNTSGNSLAVDIETDQELAKTGIINFVDAYNALKLFAARQKEVGDDGKPVDTAILSNDSTLNLTLSKLTSEMTAIVDGLSGSQLSRLSDLGITASDYPGDDTTPFTRNILTVDEEKLKAAISSKYDEVRQVFEFDYSSDDPNLQVFSRTNGLNTSEVTININQTTGVYTATYDLGSGSTTVNLTKETISGGSIALKGQDGTALEGMVLIYSGTGNATVNLELHQGIADRVYNTLEDLTDEETGSISLAVSSITDEDKRYENEIKRIDSMIERFREQLLQKFAALESAISSANSILQSIDANVNASNNN